MTGVRARGVPAPAGPPSPWLAAADEAVRDHGALQKAAELAGLLEVLAASPPRTVIEIGADAGGTLFAWSRLPGPPRVLAVDLPGGPFSSRRGPPERHGADLLAGDSRSPATLAAVRDWLAGEPADFVFIDGDHSYEGVRADWENYRPLVRDGGLVAFHDIVIHPQAGVGVSQLWEEIRRTWPSQEIISEPVWWGGVGILTMTAQPLPRREPVLVRRGGR